MLANLVEQTTTTTGTGAYLVAGAVPYRRTFAAALSTNDVVPYVCVASDGTFECGFGTWDETAGTLARTTITDGSNGTSPVNWSAGEKKIYLGGHTASPMGAIRHNPAAGAAPTPNDDTGDGYDSGSFWRVGNTLFVCTGAPLGFASWAPIVLGTKQPDGTVAYGPRASYFRDQNQNAHYGRTGYQFNGGYDFSVSNAYADGGTVGMAAFTTNATPKKMSYMGNYATFFGIYCEMQSTTIISGVVTARDNATGDSKAWKVEAVVKTNNTGDATVVAGSVPTELYEDAATTGWSIAVVGGAGLYDATIEVTGEAAKNITWSASLLFTTSVYY